VLKIVENKENKVAYDKLSKIADEIKNAIELAYDDITQTIKRKIIADLDSPYKTGRLYYIYKDGVSFTHQASAPGEAPATLFGGLKSSFSSNTSSSDSLTISFGNSDVRYARNLEFGDNIVSPRPYLRNNIEALQREQHEYFVMYLEKKLKANK